MMGASSSSSPSPSPPPRQQRLVLETKKHTAFFLRHLRMLPCPYVSADTQRMTIAFFCLSALDLLGTLEEKTTDEERKGYREWIWRLQQVSGGFTGSPTMPGEKSNLAMTYTALLNLAILRDDFSQLNKEGVRALLKATQQPDGSFSSCPGSLERDPRFVYCAFAICTMINDWSAIDVGKALDYLDSCRSYDGAFGQGPGQESHGGSTYCAISAYSLAGAVEHRFSQRDRRRLVSWLVARQGEQGTSAGGEDEDEDDAAGGGGFNGRINKPQDSCYSFWCGATLAILHRHDLIESKSNVAHLLSLQTAVGGIPKTEDDHPDAMHSYLSLAALAIHRGGQDEDGSDDDWRTRCGLRDGLVQGLDPCLNVGVETRKWIEERLWNSS